MYATQPNVRSERDLASPDLWTRSLRRSRHRRELAERSRGYRARRKAASYLTTATLLATPMVPRTVSAASGADDDGASGHVDPQRRLPVLLSYGSTGHSVESIQGRLNRVNGAGLAVDGIYGPLTRAAVVAFQRGHGLPKSGAVDTRTWEALFRARVTLLDAGTPAAAEVERAAGERPSTPAPEPERERAAMRLPASHGPDPRYDQTKAVTPVVDSAPAPSPAPAPKPRKPVAAPAPSGGGGGGCGSGRISWPVHGTVTGRFGENRGDHVHAGLDIAASAGTAIRAAACGTVSSAGYEGGYGNIVCIRHGGGITTCYAHMSRIGASVGRYVRVGDVIGYVGCTGNCTGPHVHFEVRVNGSPTNPVNYLNGSRRVKASRASAARAPHPTAGPVRATTALKRTSPKKARRAGTGSTGTPVQSQSAQSEPVQSQPAQSEPVQSQPAQSEPVQSQPAQSEPVQSQPAQSEPVQSEPAQSEPVQSQPAQSEPVQPEPAQSEPVQPEPAQSEQAQSEPAQSEAPVSVETPATASTNSDSAGGDSADAGSSDPAAPEPSGSAGSDSSSDAEPAESGDAGSSDAPDTAGSGSADTASAGSPAGG